MLSNEPPINTHNDIAIPCEMTLSIGPESSNPLVVNDLPELSCHNRYHIPKIKTETQPQFLGPLAPSDSWSTSVRCFPFSGFCRG